jgi:hypothetical protein
MKGAAPAAAAVQVLEEKTVAGFHAVALEAGSAGALVGWLKEHGYAFSPEVEAWAKPYVDRGWKITALRVAKGEDGQRDAAVTTAALRISFKTDRPLFPYREPDFKGAAEALGARARLLRIYFVSAARYDGELSKEWPWTGKVAWADELRTEDRTRALELLKLPPSTGPAKWWLTEFEDPWPYRPAPADLYFAKSARQEPVSRPPIIEYTGFRNDDRAPLVFAAVVALPFVARRLRRRPRDRR